MNTSSIRNGRRFWHVDLHGPLVAMGDMMTSEVAWSPRIQEQAVKFWKVRKRASLFEHSVFQLPLKTKYLGFVFHVFFSRSNFTNFLSKAIRFFLIDYIPCVSYGGKSSKLYLKVVLKGYVAIWCDFMWVRHNNKIVKVTLFWKQRRVFPVFANSPLLCAQLKLLVYAETDNNNAIRDEGPTAITISWFF